MSVSASAKISENDIKEVTGYIERYWRKLIRHNSEDTSTLIGLPNPYIVPANSEWFQEQYYWDSYPVILALLGHPKYNDLAVGMVDNLLFMVEKFGIVPNGSRFYFLSRSQPPLLSSMVWAVFESTKNVKWFRRAIELVEYEYRNVWTSDQHPNFRKIHRGLSRYYDINVLDDLAEAESGWDMTFRFKNKCLDYLPVDLNCLLYVYEDHLSKAHGLLGDFKREDLFRKAARKRAKVINRLMWSDRRDYYFDYNFVTRTRSDMVTVAGIYPLFCGIAERYQAEKSVRLLEAHLLKRYGVVQSVKFKVNKQWDWPNGWALMQLRVIEGLMNYGYLDLAEEIIKRWLAINIKLYKRTGYLWEKYDVIHGRIGVPDRYTTQHGFAWTNAVFLMLIQKLEEIESTKQSLVRGADWNMQVDKPIALP